jgi:hypothetical protein
MPEPPEWPADELVLDVVGFVVFLLLVLAAGGWSVLVWVLGWGVVGACVGLIAGW